MTKYRIEYINDDGYTYEYIEADSFKLKRNNVTFYTKGGKAFAGFTKVIKVIAVYYTEKMKKKNDDKHKSIDP